jgi:hypothetical protein
MPIILASQKAEVKRIVVGSQLGHIVCKTLSQKTCHTKSRVGADGVTEGIGPEFKPQYHKNK